MPQTVFNIHSQDQDNSITQRDILSILFKHKRIILKSFFVVTLLVSLGLMYLPPVYKAKGKILVKVERQGNPTFFSGVASYEERKQADPVNRTMETEMELVEARPIAEEVVKQLNITFSQVYHKPYIHFLTPLADAYDAVMEVLGYPPDPLSNGFSDTVNALVESIEVAPVRSKSSETTSNIMELKIRTHDKEVAGRALQAIMEVYQKHNTIINNKAGEKAHEIIKKRKDDAYAEVVSHQFELETFVSHRKNGTELQNAKKVSRRKVTSPGDISSISLLKKQVIEKEMELDELMQVYSDNHIPVKQLKKAISSIKKRIAMESQHYASNDSKLRTLERKLEIAEGIYLELKRKLAQIEIYLDMNESQTQSRIIVEPPMIPRKSEWKKTLIYGVIGSFAGLILGVGFAGFREYADHRLENASEVRRYFNMEILGTIPELEEGELEQGIAVLKKSTPQ